MQIEDSLYKFLGVYKKLPYSIKRLVGLLYECVPDKWKYGSFYYAYLARIKSFSPGDKQKLLRTQLSLAKDKIPFYVDKWGERLEDFPIVNKEIIKDNPTLFINTGNIPHIKTNTGGSSGNPFEFYIEKGVSRPKEKAHFDWYWGQFGYTPSEKTLVIRGEALENQAIYEYQPIGNKLVISCFLLNESNIESTLEKIHLFKPKFIHAYPSALKNFLFLIQENNLKWYLKIKAVFLGSEGLSKNDRELISTFFKTKIAHWYGHSERLVHAGNCPFSDMFHIYPFYGHVELLDNNDNPINVANKKGRIVATGYDNSVMPMIRYDTGDEAEYSEANDCICGFKGRSFEKIHGRKQDYIYLVDKTKVSLTAFIFGQHFPEFGQIQEIQLEQNVIGKLEVRIVPRAKEVFSVEDFEIKLRDSVDCKLDVKVWLVEHIEKTATGKHVFFKQKIRDID